MPKVTVLPHHEICPEGAEVELQAGENLCKALLEKGIKTTYLPAKEISDTIRGPLVEIGSLDT